MCRMTNPVAALFAAVVLAGQTAGDPTTILGTWRGTSICVDRAAAPACTDETVVYELTPGKAPGTVHWVADKTVNGQRLPMGELDLIYDAADARWEATFTNPRVTVEWWLSVAGPTMTGGARLMPTKQTVRKIDLKKG
jgi:hypothetical protein